MIEQGVVTWVSDNGTQATVQIPRLTGTDQHGPIPVLDSVDLTTGDTTVVVGHSHGVPIRLLARGDQVLVAAVGGIADNWHVLGRLP